MKRGEIVIVDFPFSDQSGSKRRPALVVQSDQLRRVTQDTILASVSTTAKADNPTHVMLDANSDPGSGLHVACGVRCEKLLVVERKYIRGALGKLGEVSMRRVNQCLRIALDL